MQLAGKRANCLKEIIAAFTVNSIHADGLFIGPLTERWYMGTKIPVCVRRRAHVTECADMHCMLLGRRECVGFLIGTLLDRDKRRWLSTSATLFNVYCASGCVDGETLAFGVHCVYIYCFSFSQ